MFLVKGDAPEK